MTDTSDTKRYSLPVLEVEAILEPLLLRKMILAALKALKKEPALIPADSPCRSLLKKKPRDAFVEELARKRYQDLGRFLKEDERAKVIQDLLGEMAIAPEVIVLHHRIRKKLDDCLSLRDGRKRFLRLDAGKWRTLIEQSIESLAFIYVLAYLTDFFAEESPEQKIAKRQSSASELGSRWCPAPRHEESHRTKLDLFGEVYDTVVPRLEAIKQKPPVPRTIRDKEWRYRLAEELVVLLRPLDHELSLGKRGPLNRLFELCLKVADEPIGDKQKTKKYLRSAVLKHP